MRKKSNKKTVSPFPTVYKFNPEPQALQREATTNAQRDFAEDTLIWGEQNNFPLLLAKTVQSSPAATSCIGTIAKFIKGAGFTDPELMKLKVNKNGQTLWDLHSVLSESMAWIRGFAVNFKFNGNLKITNAYNMPIENARFVKPQQDTDTNIRLIKYNPYFGTTEYKHEYTKLYPLWSPEDLPEQLHEEGTNFPGQVYYYGETSPLFRFYPMPDYWSAEFWMKSDGEFQLFTYKEIKNGFFQSVIWSMIGDPSAPSKNPKYMKEETGADNVTRKVSTKTIGEEFDEWMSENFSGSDKAGTAVVLWAINKDQLAQVQAFPVTISSDRLIAQQNLTTKNITIATRVPGILANISEGVSLGSGGSEMQKAVEIMQSNTVDWRNTLMQFYNEVMLPNMEGVPAGARVDIINYNPISVPVEIEDKFWNVLSETEKRNFVKKNFPSMQFDEIEPVAVGEPVEPVEGERKVMEVNENIKNMTGRQRQAYHRIIREYGSGKLTEAQARLELRSGFGMSEQEINECLGIETDLQVAV